MKQLEKAILLIIMLSVISCSKTKEPYQLPQNAIELISGKNEKTWKLAKRLNNKIRMNMGDCFLSYRQIFMFKKT